MMRDGFRPGRRFRAARRWSNRVLGTIAPVFDGDVINVSGWRDEDKEGRRYRDYFINARSYAVTNVGGYRGDIGAADIELDLEKDLPPHLHYRADIVFNHTTLEHVFDVFKAVANLCAITRDVVIVVVPAIQEEHPSESFGDYWRFTTGGLTKLFEVNGLSTVALTSSPYRNCAVYHLCVAARHPKRWADLMPSLDSVNDGRDFFNETLLERVAHRLTSRGRPD